MLAGLVWLLGGSRWGGAALAVSGLLIWVTGSRAAFWGWLLLLVVWWWGLGRWRWSMLGVLVGGAFLLAWQPEWLGRLSQATTLDSSAQSRLVIWQVAMRAFLEYPWTGVGFGNFPVYYQIHRPQGALEAITGHAHNLWLHLVAEGGGLALLGFLLWLGGLLGWLIRLQAGRVLALVAVVLVLGLFDFSFFFAGVYYTLLLALGVCISRFDSSPQGRHRIPG
nr:O-antigen ligase family protein [Meiothermus taiwanensis]